MTYLWSAQGSALGARRLLRRLQPDRDLVRREPFPGAGTVVVEPWDKVGPKYRRLFHIVAGGRMAFGGAGLARIVGGLLSDAARAGKEAGRG